MHPTKAFILGIGAALLFGSIALFGFIGVKGVATPGSDFDFLASVPLERAAPETSSKSPVKKETKQETPKATKAVLKETVVTSSVPFEAFVATNIVTTTVPASSTTSDADEPVKPKRPKRKPDPPVVTTPQVTEVLQSEPVVVPDGLAVSEVMVGTEADGNDEFVELFNGTGQDISLTGFSIRKKTSTGTESALVSAARLKDKIIPAGKHFLIVHEGSYAGAAPADASWPASYSLAYANNAVVLYGPNGEKLAELAWVEIPKNQSSAFVVPTPQNSSD